MMEEGRNHGGHKRHDGEGKFLIKTQCSVFIVVLVRYSFDAIGWSKQKSGLRDVKNNLASKGTREKEQWWPHCRSVIRTLREIYK